MYITLFRETSASKSSFVITENLLLSGILHSVGFIAPNNFEGIDLIIPFFLKNGQVSCIKIQIKNFAKLNRSLRKIVYLFAKMTTRTDLKFSVELVNRPSLSLIIQFFSHEDVDICAEQYREPTFFARPAFTLANSIINDFFDNEESNISNENDNDSDYNDDDYVYNDADMSDTENEEYISKKISFYFGQKESESGSETFEIYKIQLEKPVDDKNLQAYKITHPDGNICSYGIASFGMKVFKNIKNNS